MIDHSQVEKLTEIRKKIHANPELSGNEHQTHKTITEFLENQTNARIITVAETGVLAVFNSGSPGPVVMVRGDIDALPIAETNHFEYASKNPGVSHKCGHDGHTAILLGLAKHFSDNLPVKGTLLLLFQPAEENGMGAAAVLSDDAFKVFSPDFVFALHNLPGYPLHQVVVKEMEFTTGVKSMVLKMTGKTAHAAEPDKGINPGLAMAEILIQADRLTNNEPAADDFFLMTAVHATLGEEASYGISAGYGELHFTIRSRQAKLLEQRCTEITGFVQQVCRKHHLHCDISWTQEFHANINHPEAVQMVRNAANNASLSLSERAHPFPWGEDFGLFTQHFKGAMFGLGAGVQTPALHNPDYDFPDELIPTGIAMFTGIINQLL